MLGWMDNWQYASKLPTSPWRGQMTIPREITLKTFPDGIRLVQKPAGIFDKAGKPTSSTPNARSFEMTAVLGIGSAREAGWKLDFGNDAFVLIGYNATRHEVFVDRIHSGLVAFSRDFPVRVSAPRPQIGSALDFRVLIDRNSVELFAAGGRVTLTNFVFPPSTAPPHIEFFSDRAARQSALTIRSLNNIRASTLKDK